MNQAPAVEHLDDGTIRSRVFSRIGLLGNPSDGYNGRVLAVLCTNYCAEVELTPREAGGIEFKLNSEGDPTHFADLKAFETHIDGNGFYGGLRLLMAMTKQLAAHCKAHAIPLPTSSCSFSLSYKTTIPRQRGLGGSSAIACAALNCLLDHFGIAAAVPPSARPELVWAAETQQLGISAGLQDRIIQVYGGAVLMDFTQSQPQWESINAASLPQLFLIYPADNKPSGKDSGEIHAAFNKRWAEGDNATMAAMQAIAALAEAGAAALRESNPAALAPLIKRNAILRQQLFGSNAEEEGMMAVVIEAGAAAKLTGSGGALVAFCPGGQEQASLHAACAAAGLQCEPVIIGPVHHWALSK